MRDYLVALGFDADDPRLIETPRRVALAGLDLFSGVDLDPVVTLGGGEPIDGAYPGPVAVRGIPYTSICEHHLLPFRGTISIAYLPDRLLAGLGRFDAMVRVLAARPQLQERLADEVAQTVQDALGARGALVRLDADQSCMWARGERTVGATAVSLAARGVYEEGAPRAEALALLGA